MTIMSDNWIKEMANYHDMITPFVKEQVKNGVISYGLSSYGYDARISNEFKIFSDTSNTTIDPKNFNDLATVDIKGDLCIIPPNGFALATTVERFKIPNDVISICVGKSTYARCGIIVNVTPIEPGWEGHVTIELANTTPVPVLIYANEGICQFLFFKGNDKCDISYSDRDGKYMGQEGITLPKV